MEEVEESVDDCTTSHRFQPRAALCLLAASSSGTVFSRVCDPWTAGCCNAAASCPNEYEASIVVREKREKGEAFLFLLPSFVGMCVAKSYGWLTRLHLRIWTFQWFPPVLRGWPMECLARFRRPAGTRRICWFCFGCRVRRVSSYGRESAVCSGASIKMPPSGLMKLSKNDAMPVNVVGEAVVGDAFAFVPGVDVDTFLVALRARRRPPTIWAFCILVIGCILVVVVAVLDGMVCVCEVRFCFVNVQRKNCLLYTR